MSRFLTPLKNKKYIEIYSPSNPKVKSLLKTYDSVKTVERIRKSIVATPWEKFFKRFAQNKKNIKGASDKVIQRNYYYLQLCFLLLKKEYIEQITKQECRKLSELMFRVPKGWRRMLKTNPNITSILTNNPKKALTRQTISQFLFTFKEFMRFAAREDIIPYSLNEFVDVPQKIEQFKRAPFESDELRKIFNPDTYPNPKSRSNAARFWVPLIGLYQGCRLNEICQLDTADIVVIKKIPCISINDNGKDKSVKNKGSERIIPIHPQLIQLGFLHYVRYCQQNHSHKLFSDKIKLMKSSYKRGVQAWFCRYIDGLGIDDPSKVFHSFRHTFATKAIEKRIPTEYQNALGGWVDRGIGQRIYGHKRDIRVMYQELCKIKYPINRELKELETEFKNSYVMSCLRP